LAISLFGGVREDLCVVSEGCIEEFQYLCSEW
jgi:hypothetical protein